MFAAQQANADLATGQGARRSGGARTEGNFPPGARVHVYRVLDRESMTTYRHVVITIDVDDQILGRALPEFGSTRALRRHHCTEGACADIREWGALRARVGPVRSAGSRSRPNIGWPPGTGAVPGREARNGQPRHGRMERELRLCDFASATR